MGRIDPKKLWQGLKKYRYAALVLLLGLALLLLPTFRRRPLLAALQQIAGAGQVSVMLTLETRERVEYQTDVQASSDGAQSSESRKTVILSEGSSYDKAAVAATTYPRFQGALIVCEGADSAAVRLRLLEAVSAVTGLSTDRITVVKMRS